MGWSFSSTFLKLLRFHSSQCAVFSHSAYVETSESWLSIHGSQMHYLRCWASSGVARLLCSRGSSSAVSIPSNRSVEAVRSPEQGRVVLDLGRRQISVQRQGQTLGPWPVAIGDPKTPTPSGLFKVEDMMMNPQYQSTNSGKLHPKRGPQSPLGHRWIGFLRSGPNQFGIHGTPWPHWVKTRSAVSNGCVRMLNAHVQQLYDHVEVGMAVEIMR